MYPLSVNPKMRAAAQWPLLEWGGGGRDSVPDKRVSDSEVSVSANKPDIPTNITGAHTNVPTQSYWGRPGWETEKVPTQVQCQQHQAHRSTGHKLCPQGSPSFPESLPHCELTWPLLLTPLSPFWRLTPQPRGPWTRLSSGFWAFSTSVPFEEDTLPSAWLSLSCCQACRCPLS